MQGKIYDFKESNIDNYFMPFDMNNEIKQHFQGRCRPTAA